MAAEDSTTTTKADLRFSNIPPARIECVLEASYELESLAINFPLFRCDENLELSDEYHQKLFVRRIKELSRVVMSAIDDDRETNELRRIVGLED